MIDKLMKNYALAVEKRLGELLPENSAEYRAVTDAARYSLFLGGKRIRPIIMLEFCRLYGGDTASVIDFAAALEMIHTYSLIHDDLPCMDNDDMRRGAPSCHKRFGEANALLAGDALLTKAFFVAANANATPECRLKTVERLSFYAGESGMIGGQVLDLKFENEEPGAEALLTMYSMKTGALLRAAAEIGCIAAGADETTINAASDFAYNLGLCFQITDDILDCTADEALLGKPIGSDEKNSKATFVTLCGLEAAKAEAAALTKKALGILEKAEGDTRELKEITEALLKRKY